MKDLIQKDMVAAMKAGDKTRVGVLRMLLSEIKAGETAPQGQQIDALTAVTRYRKKTAASMEEFKTMPEALSKLREEILVIDHYLPRGPSEADLKAFVTSLDKSLPLGTMMKEVKSKFPAADGKLTSVLVKAHIGS